MKLTRDSVILWVGWVGGLAGIAVGYAGLIPAEYRDQVIAVAGLVGSICGWLKTSPLLGERKM